MASFLSEYLASSFFPASQNRARQLVSLHQNKSTIKEITRCKLWAAFSSPSRLAKKHAIPFWEGFFHPPGTRESVPPEIEYHAHRIR